MASSRVPRPAGASSSGARPRGNAPDGALPTSASGSPGLWIVLGILALLTVTGLGIMSLRGNRPDPHFLEAQKMLRDYELGKEPSQLDYQDPAYPAALAELGLVRPGSVSAEPARQLASDLNGKILAFREGLKRRQAEMEAAAKARDERDRTLAAAQNGSTGVDVLAADRVTLQGATACQEEKAGYAKHQGQSTH